MSDVVVLAIPTILTTLLFWWRLRPRLSRTLALSAGIAVLAFIGLWKLSSVRAAVVGPTVLRVDTDQPLVALSFDDGPTPAYTNRVLQMLDDADAKATFFVTGAELSGHPELGRAILQGGHELGNHSWSHPRLVFRSDRFLHQQVDDTDAAIRAVGQPGPILFRPPYGKRLWGLHAVLGERAAVLWDVEPESFPDDTATPEAFAAHVLDRVRPGSIVLLHVMYESRETSRRALPLVLDGLRERGLQSVTVRELLARGGES